MACFVAIIQTVLWPVLWFTWEWVMFKIWGTIPTHNVLGHTIVWLGFEISALGYAIA